jgi:hypothetical protein
MAAAAAKLTYEEFLAIYGTNDADHNGFEYWYGEALPKRRATLRHRKLN